MTIDKENAIKELCHNGVHTKKYTSEVILESFFFYCNCKEEI